MCIHINDYILGIKKRFQTLTLDLKKLTIFSAILCSMYFGEA